MAAPPYYSGAPFRLPASYEEDPANLAEVYRLQESFGERLLRDLRPGQEVDLPSTSAPGIFSDIGNAIVGQALPGLRLFGRGGSKSAIDLESLSPEEQAEFAKLSRSDQAFATSKNPLALARFAETETGRRILADPVDPDRHRYNAMLDPGWSKLPEALKQEQVAANIDYMERAGIIPQGSGQGALERMQVGELSPGDIRNYALLKSRGSRIEDPGALAEVEAGLQRKADESASKIAKERASEASSYASAASARENVRRSKKGVLYRFANGPAMSDESPEFARRLAAGEIPYEISALSGTEAGAASAFPKTTNVKGREQFAISQALVSEIADVGSTILNSPKPILAVSSVMNKAPWLGYVPWSDAMLDKLTGKTQEELSAFQATANRFAAGVVQRTLKEPGKVTDFDRKLSDEINRLRGIETIPAAVGKMRTAYKAEIAAFDKYGFDASEGREFTFDVDSKEGQAAFLREVLTREEGGTGNGILTFEQAQEMILDLRKSQDQYRRIYRIGATP